MNNVSMVEQQPVWDGIAAVPTLEELQRAVNRMPCGRAAGSSGILPQVKAGGPRCMPAILDVVKCAWDAQEIPQDWINCNLVPISKKGNLAICDNWRGISLLEVMGKAVASLIQQRLQVLAESILPDTQCGFRRGRSCTDMVFTVRRFMEKLYEHRCKGFLVFVDLRKAYDSVNRESLWFVLGRAGVPDRLVRIIQAFHDNMKASLVLAGADIDPIDVNNGLRQGSCMAPVMLNIYMWAVFQQWYKAIADIPDIGLPVATNAGGRLLFRRSRTDVVKRHNDCQFADDSALVATSHEGAQQALAAFVRVAGAFSLKVNLAKTKVMPVGYGLTAHDRLPLMVVGDIVESVADFRYLGSIVHTDGRWAHDIKSLLEHRGASGRCVARCSWTAAYQLPLSARCMRHVLYPCCSTALSAGCR